MICYHGTPITPNRVLRDALDRRHAMVSFYRPDQIGMVAEICESFALDNGAFSAWRSGKPVTNWAPYVAFCREWGRHPACDWAIIPDVIDGSEADNDALLDWWGAQDVPLDGVPVWHLHESLARLDRLARDFTRVALGSSGTFAEIGTDDWWQRMGEAMEVVCDEERRPRVKLHGLRMLDATVLSHIPFASADSTNAARNHDREASRYAISNEEAAILIMRRIERHAKAARWSGVHGHRLSMDLLG